MKKYDIININEFTYNLKLHGDNVFPIYQSIKKSIKNVHYDSETISIFFSAETVISLKEYLLSQIMSHSNCVKMIDDLTKQMFILKNIGYSFYGFDIDDILIVDNIFIFCSSEYLLPIIEDDIIFYSPIKPPYFTSPEILKLTNLPSEINYKCSYYGLGILIVFCLLDKYLLVGNEIKSVEDIEYILAPLYNTKIYWFIKRCLNENIDKRILLLI